MCSIFAQNIPKRVKCSIVAQNIPNRARCAHFLLKISQRGRKISYIGRDVKKTWQSIKLALFTVSDALPLVGLSGSPMFCLSSWLWSVMIMIIMIFAISEVIHLHIPSVHRVTNSDSPLLSVLLLHHFQAPGLPTPYYKYFRYLLTLPVNNWTILDLIKVCVLKFKPCYDEHRIGLIRTNVKSWCKPPSSANNTCEARQRTWRY